MGNSQPSSGRFTEMGLGKYILRSLSSLNTKMERLDVITGQRDVLKGLSLGGKSLSLYQGFCRTRQSPMCQVNWKELGQGCHWESC